jgi:hypothetical protein
VKYLIEKGGNINKSVSIIYKCDTGIGIQNIKIKLPLLNFIIGSKYDTNIIQI